MNISKSRISLHYSCGSRISSTELFVRVILKREVQFCTVSKSAEEKIFNHKAPNSLQSLASNLCGCTKGSNGYTALLGTFWVLDLLKSSFVADFKHLKIISGMNTWSLKPLQDGMKLKFLQWKCHSPIPECWIFGYGALPLLYSFFPDRYSFCTNSVFRKQGYYLLNRGRFQRSVAAVLFADSICRVNMFFCFLQFFD